MARMIGLVLAVATLAAASAGAQANPFLGEWNITATTPAGSYPYWLEGPRGERDSCSATSSTGPAA